MFSNYYHVDGNEYIGNAKVYGLKDSIMAAKYPMSADISQLNGKLTLGIIKLAQCVTGTGHDQFLTGIVTQFDLTLTNKAWVEAERYHFFDFVSSQSTMHRITSFDLDSSYNEYVDPRSIEVVQEKINEYNDLLSKEADKKLLAEKYLEVLYNNPAGFKLTARMTTNYRQLKTIYQQRRNHRLPDWQFLCDWIETLPASFLITGKESNVVSKEYPKVIAISGHAGSGKDTAAKFIHDKLVKDGYRVLVTHFADLLKYICTKFFGWNGIKDEQGRQLLQYIGTDMVRNQYPDYWVDFIAKIIDMFGSKWDYVLIPDTRFPNEVFGLRDRGIETVHVRVERNDFVSTLTESQQKHRSETALDGVEPDFIIQNEGTLDELYNEIDRLLKEILTDE